MEMTLVLPEPVVDAMVALSYLYMGGRWSGRQLRD